MSFCSGGRTRGACDCTHHTTNEAHVTACCRACPYCSKDIEFSALEDHMVGCQEEQLKILRACMVGDNVIDVSWKDGETAMLIGGQRGIAVCVRVHEMPRATEILDIHIAFEGLGISPSRVLFSITPCVDVTPLVDSASFDCDCDCHTSPHVIHMVPCCGRPPAITVEPR